MIFKYKALITAPPILPKIMNYKNIFDENSIEIITPPFRVIESLNEDQLISLLINVGRGPTLCEKVLITHLKKYKQFYASLDVFEKEPLPKSSPLWKLLNVTVTPHIASLTLVDTAVEYIYKKYKQYKKNGKIKSDVNLIKGY